MALGRWQLLFTGVLMLVPGCGKGVTDAIDAQVRAGATTVDIGHLTDFNWDRLFVFGPYSFPEMIRRLVNGDRFIFCQKELRSENYFRRGKWCRDSFLRMDRLWVA